MKEPNNLEDFVPGRPSTAELKAMALRQQQQIDTQHQLLAAKEQRLRYLKAQEVRGAAAAAEGERLRRLRERVEAQESKLRRLRALRGQVDLQKTYNVTLSNDLDSIRALFSEKEKELSLAVAKVDALTRQLEELRRDRRGPLNLIPGVTTTNGTQPIASSQAALEFDKLRRELMYRNQLSLQQDARLHLQREALQQRQAELRSVDQRILELQNRLHKKKASNLILQTQQLQSQQHTGTLTNSNNNNSSNNNNNNNGNNNNIALHSTTNKPSNSVYPSQRIIPRGNVAAVEPYIHTPQKTSSSSSTTTQLSSNNTQHTQLKKQQYPIQDLTNFKSNHQQNNNINVNHIAISDSDELTKFSKQKLLLHVKQSSKDSSENEIDADAAAKTKKIDPKYQTLPYSTKIGLSKSASSGAIPTYTSQSNTKTTESDSEKGVDSDSTQNSKSSGNQPQHQQLTVHSIPLGTINKSVAVAISSTAGSTATTNSTKTTTKPATTNHTRRSIDRPSVKPKAKQHLPSGNLVVPPRKPISSVAPTSITMAPKIVAHSPKVHVVAPTPIVSASESETHRPALPPKPSKNIECDPISNSIVSSVPTVVSVINKIPVLEPIIHPPSSSDNINGQSTTFLPSTNPDNLPIKAKPLTIKKQPLSEQPRLRSMNNATVKPMQYISRRIEMPPAFLFPEIEKCNLKDKSGSQSPNGSANIDETDKSTSSSQNGDDGIGHSDVIKRTRSVLAENGKAKLARRVSFDPLALLLDASLEGELELVRKTTMQVPNPSAANDEGITALHNAICAGHFPIVKFLVEYGCDVNAQDSDGWTPLHCAASCNNLEMVKFLVENGACLFAATLSDHETPAEKCEEDEEGFDGCSEYLYSIQEKLGILNNGEVHAVFSYDSQQSDELSFEVNDRLIILRKGDDAEREWWWARLPANNDQEGYVPRNLLGLYPRVPLQHSLDQSD